MKLSEFKCLIREEVQGLLNEASLLPSNVEEFAKRYGEDEYRLVKKVATWAKKAGKVITDGVAIGKWYSTLVLDLTRHGAEIYIDLDNMTVKVHDIEVDNYESFKKALENRGNHPK